MIASCSAPKKQADQDTVAGFRPHPQRVSKHEVSTLTIGSPAPAFTLPDVHGKMVSLADFSEATYLVIVFTCNHCPTAQAYEDRLIQFTSDYKDKGVQVAAIMPNSAAALMPEECGYTDLTDNFEEMVIRSDYKKFNFPYLYDGDDEAVSIQYGPVATPHAFVFDRDRKLQYVGRMDGIEKPGKANAEDLRQAMDELIAGKPVTNAVTKSFGCSVKWGWKDEYNAHVLKEWMDKPVALEKLTDAGIREVIANKSDKLRLINVWATWCAPCVAEYPSIVELQRWYGARSFEFISLSADNPDKEKKALEFLQKKHSPVKNYLYDGEDKYKLIEAVDREWNGALPYTLLVEPGGKIVYRNQGTVDLLELKRAIVEHPLIGRFY
ncbi:MAG: redoxin family protein [Cyclobacteriaceae bacterium]|nr:redoxin family protein [Cyclobacteriaceae bacterium]